MKILIADDDPICMEILTDALSEKGWTILQAANGSEALEILQKNQDTDLILLDRKMPVLDGLETLQWIKKEPLYAKIPVIMQTAVNDISQIIEGINAGVYYYLTKPYEKDLLLSIVDSAATASMDYKLMQSEHTSLHSGMALLTEGMFEFRNMEQARHICILIAFFFNQDQNLYRGLWELLVNAIEHGNLGITGKEKNNLIMSGQWESEVATRLTKPEYKQKKALLRFKKAHKSYSFEIQDEGNGFDWEHLEQNMEKNILSPSGRGIYIAKKILKKLCFVGKGNISSFEVEIQPEMLRRKL